jgi:hypothetical protein
MSKARFDGTETPHDHIGRAIDLLNQAQEIVDTLDHPHIGARLQEVIDEVEQVGRAAKA